MVSSTPDPFPILLMDGGLGTTLEANHSQKFDDSTPLWSSDLLLDEPSRNILLNAQRSFVNAGVDILLTATYQASLEGFSKTRRRKEENGRVVPLPESEGCGGGGGQEPTYYSDEDESSHLMRSAIPLAHTAITQSSTTDKRDTKAKIALSLGPYGATMVPSTEYSGNYDASHSTTPQLLSWHKKRLDIYQVEAETWYEIDYVAFETVPRIEEVEAVRRAMYSSVNGWDRKFWISCVFPGDESAQADKNFKLPDGSGVRELVEAMLEGAEGRALPWGVGINCTKIRKIPALIHEFEDAVEALIREGKVDGWPFLVLYPDGAEGLVYDTEKHVWEASDPKAGNEATVPWDERMIGIVKGVRDGRRWRGLCVGGCCKILPLDIANLRRRIDDEL